MTLVLYRKDNNDVLFDTSKGEGCKSSFIKNIINLSILHT